MNLYNRAYGYNYIKITNRCLWEYCRGIILKKDYGDLFEINSFDEIRKDLFIPNSIKRDDKDLIYVMEPVKNPSGRFSSLKIVEIPNDVNWIVKSELLTRVCF